MSKNAYIGVEGVARKVKKMYIGVDGVAREVTKAYVGVNGVARLFYQNVINIGAAVVTLGAALTYNGKSQTKAVSSVVLDGVTLVAGVDYTVSGNTGKNAGNYTMTITGMGDYEGTVTAAWSIAKAAGSISVSPTSLTLVGAAGTAKTATITYTGDGAISAASNKTGVATASVSGTTVTVKSVADGSATITITLAAGTNYKGASCRIAVTTLIASKTLEDNSWDTIAKIAAAGVASSIWKVGDSKKQNLDTGTYYARIVGFNHDNLNPADAKYNDSSYNGGKNKAGITFDIYPIRSYTKVMNSSSTNVGGWEASAMRSTQMPDWKGWMPTALQNALRTVSKLTSEGGKSSVIVTSADEVFLLSEVEVLGTSSKSFAGEGTQYSYFKAGNDAIKGRAGSAASWALRSPSSADTTKFVEINASGAAAIKSASTANGMAPGFCI